MKIDDNTSTIEQQSEYGSAVATSEETMMQAEETSSPKYLIECDGLVKLYKTSDVEVVALQGLELGIEKGELIAIIGKSGSGKSTLLNIIGALEHPSAGRIIIDGEDLSHMTDKQLEELRRKKIGFIWQKSTQNLFSYMTAVENVESQLYYDKKISKAERRKKALALLEETGLGDKANSYPRELSGGEQQRVAIAAALIRDPEILLADEPTGAVDSKTSDMIQNLFRKLNRERGITVIIVTHDLSLANKVDRVVMISDGRVTTEKIIKEQYREQIMNMNSETTDMSEIHEEFSVLDKAGRLKLSDEVREQTGLNSSRVKVEVIDGKVVISSVDSVENE
jgi:ABC-type antimicrobial peptide transport system, ATPase component